MLAAQDGVLSSINWLHGLSKLGVRPTSFSAWSNPNSSMSVPFRSGTESYFM